MDLIGSGKNQLIPNWQPKGTGLQPEGRRGRPFATQHTRPVGPPPPPKNPKGRRR